MGLVQDLLDNPDCHYVGQSNDLGTVLSLLSPVSSSEPAPSSPETSFVAEQKEDAKLEESKVDASAARKEALKQERIKRAKGECILPAFLCLYLCLCFCPPSSAFTSASASARPTAKSKQTPEDRELLNNGASPADLLDILEQKIEPESDYRT